jgi:hypothetical protein
VCERKRKIHRVKTCIRKEGKIDRDRFRGCQREKKGEREKTERQKRTPKETKKE